MDSGLSDDIQRQDRLVEEAVRAADQIILDGAKSPLEVDVITSRVAMVFTGKATQSAWHTFLAAKLVGRKDMSTVRGLKIESITTTRTEINDASGSS
jgi:hypothetical protein